AQAHEPVDRGLILLSEMDIDVGIIGDQFCRPPGLGHDGVAGVDAEPALDAAEIGSVADVDTGRANVNALQAVDTVAGREPALAQNVGLLQRGARLTAIVSISDVE